MLHLFQRHAPRVGADPCVCPPCIPILFVFVRADRLLPSSRRGWGRWSAPTYGCADGGLWAVPGAYCGLCPGRVKSGLARRVEGGLPETGGVWGRFLIEAEAFSGTLVLHCKDTKKSWNFQIISRKITKKLHFLFYLIRYQAVTNDNFKNTVYKGVSRHFEDYRTGRIWYRWQMAVI